MHGQLAADTAKVLLVQKPVTLPQRVNVDPRGRWNQA